ncbi:MAG: hypothetical protein K5866_06120 [Treponema sp.]|nr:hypothetical protein [Treponema sp.]
MSDLVNEILKGKKTFFITPDESLISEYFLSEYLYKDYECYFINNDNSQSIQNKIEAILSVFLDSILFFNIDYEINGLDWFNYISQLQAKYPEVCIGVTYLKRNSLAERVNLEHRYLYDLGIKGGCIQLEYQQNTNFVKIEKVLKANQAMGRRNTIRAFCYKSCSFSYEDKKGRNITKNIFELSVSHFTVSIKKDEEEALDIKEYEKIPKVTFVIRGLRFIYNAILYMIRESDDEILYVFAFISDSDKIGLDIQKKKLVIQKMYEIMNSRCLDVLANSYDMFEFQTLNKKKSSVNDIIFDESLSEQVIK